MNSPFSIIAILITSLTLFSCTTIDTQNDWPTEIPAKAVFLQYYDNEPLSHRNILKEEDYLLWVNRFYYGWALYKRGWVQATNELEATVDDPQDKIKAKQLMVSIGNKIAPEWSKHSTYRSITTRHLSIWGNTINTSIAQGQQMETLPFILSDVNALLNNTLDGQAITAARYFSQTSPSETPFGSSIEGIEGSEDF